MTGKDIIKYKRFMVIICVLFTLGGILLPLLPVLIPTADYDESIRKQIVIASVDRVCQYKGASFHRITTEDGNITEVLPRGKTVSIRYYENKILFQIE